MTEPDGQFLVVDVNGDTDTSGVNRNALGTGQIEVRFGSQRLDGFIESYAADAL